MSSKTDKKQRRDERALFEASSEASPPAQSSPGGRSWIAGLVAVALLATFVVQAMVAARHDSVTIDEYVHLPIGLHALRTGDFRQDPINSHLPRMLAALPLLADPPVFSVPKETAVWGLGGYFMEANVDRYQEFYVKARSMIVLLSLLAALVMAKWAYDLYGSRAALVSLALFAFSPSLLAHGHLVTLDMAGTLGFLLALYANWRLLDSPTTKSALWLGAAIGVANLLKLSGLVLVAMILATWAVRIVGERRDALPLRRWAALLMVVGVAALAVVNLGYGMDGTFGLLGEATLAPGGKLSSLAEAAPWLRLPLPRPFLNGIDMVLEVGKGHEPSYFLSGELSADGWWYYHLAAFAAKCPLPVLIAAILATLAWATGIGRGFILSRERDDASSGRGKYDAISPGPGQRDYASFGRGRRDYASFGRGRRDYAVFVPVLLLFAANSAFNSLYIGERHVLAAYPLLFIGISPWIAAGLAKRWAPAAAAVVVLGWTIAGTLSVSPRYLQYFNEEAGGPEGGHRVLIDSNIDWGQDLIRLREYMDVNDLDTVGLAYFGRVHPGVYGIKFTPLERGVSHGKVVISATFLMGRPYFWYLGGRMRWVPARTYEWLQGHKPIARVGSMFVFDLGQAAR